MSITVSHLTKRFGTFTALDDVSIKVGEGELLALLGPSGSGKTTLLRVIAGLESADSGSVHYDDRDMTSRSARERNVGFCFQHYALFRHMNVYENIAFGLRVRGQKKQVINDRVNELLHLVRLETLAKRYPSQLSGGQRQRIALARALAIQPRVLLLDEPFGALDAKVRQELRQWLRRLHDEIHMTSVFVTHDQEEAFEVAERVVVMNQGKVEQAGTPDEVFEHPVNPFVMDFLGNVNVFHGRVQNGKAHAGGLELDYPAYSADESRPATVYVRPHELDLNESRDHGVTSLEAQVLRVNPTGTAVKVTLAAVEFGFELSVELSFQRYAELGIKAGDVVYVSPRRATVFVPDGEVLDYAI